MYLLQVTMKIQLNLLLKRIFRIQIKSNLNEFIFQYGFNECET